MAVNDQDYAIVIGINAYPQLRPLKAAHKDATAFAEWLRSDAGGGLPAKNIELILSPETAAEQPANPGQFFPLKRHIDEAVFKLGINRLQRIGRRFYFYFSGHGVGPRFNEVAMLMAAAAMNNLNSNIGLNSYREVLRLGAAFDEVVFILDCCRDPSPRVSNFVPMPAEITPPPEPRGPVEDFVVMAASYGEKAFEPTDPGTGERTGVLTKALLEGLNGKAANPKGEVTAFSLREYLLTRVKELATDAKMKQEPEIPALPNREIVFARVAPAAPADAVKARIIAPAGLEGDLVLFDSTPARQELERRKASEVTKDLPEWVKDLQPNTRYEVEHTASELVAVLDTSKAKEKAYVFRFPRPE